ncbi:unnamed protein product, partial [Meganyctiphanes norvegica]
MEGVISERDALQNQVEKLQKQLNELKQVTSNRIGDLETEKVETHNKLKAFHQEHQASLGIFKSQRSVITSIKNIFKNLSTNIIDSQTINYVRDIVIWTEKTEQNLDNIKIETYIDDVVQQGKIRTLSYSEDFKEEEISETRLILLHDTTRKLFEVTQDHHYDTTEPLSILFPQLLNLLQLSTFQLAYLSKGT